MKELETYCEKHEALRYGELTRAFEAFIHAAGMLLAEGYRIETPIGTFAPKLSLSRQITNPDEVEDRFVQLDGVEYNPGKLWNAEMAKWHDGFRRYQNPDTQVILADQEKLEQVLRQCLDENHGYVTASQFARRSGLTLYSSRKQLNEWTKGNNAKLMMTPMGKTHIYTEI